MLKIAEEKKSIPIELAPKKIVTESEPERLMTKKQKREYEEEMARRQRRQERIEAEKAAKKGVKIFNINTLKLVNTSKLLATFILSLSCLIN